MIVKNCQAVNSAGLIYFQRKININLKNNSMKKTKLKRLIAIQEKLHSIPKYEWVRTNNGEYIKKWNLTKNRIHKIESEILIAQSDELFFIKVEQALNDGWAGSLQETSNFTDLLEEARNGDAEACGMLKNVFKFNKNFKKETGVFANV